MISPNQENDNIENHLVCIVDNLWGKKTNKHFSLYGELKDYEFV